jgi:hypothetical protein
MEEIKQKMGVTEVTEQEIKGTWEEWDK